MSTAIVLPTLSAWAASHLSGLLESKTQAAFNRAFDATFASKLDATVNGKHLSRDQYKQVLLDQSGAAPLEADASVQIEGQTVSLGDQGQLAGLVGLFYTSLDDSKYLVLGAPVETRTLSSINMTIEPTEKNPQPPTLHIRGYFDPRRVTVVNQIFSETTLHVTIPASSVPAQKAASTGQVELGPDPLNVPPKQKRSLPGVVRLPPGEMGAGPETLPGFGAFGVGPAIIPGETVGDIVQRGA